MILDLCDLDLGDMTLGCVQMFCEILSISVEGLRSYGLDRVDGQTERLIPIYPQAVFAEDINYIIF